MDIRLHENDFVAKKEVLCTSTGPGTHRKRLLENEDVET